jgi:hypothetical protein
MPRAAPAAARAEVGGQAFRRQRRRQRRRGGLQAIAALNASKSSSAMAMTSGDGIRSKMAETEAAW